MTIITSKIIRISSTRLCDCTFVKFNPVSYLPVKICVNFGYLLHSDP
jgi:hypothetical protein